MSERITLAVQQFNASHIGYARTAAQLGMTPATASVYADPAAQGFGGDTAQVIAINSPYKYRSITAAYSPGRIFDKDIYTSIRGAFLDQDLSGFSGDISTWVSPGAQHSFGVFSNDEFPPISDESVRFPVKFTFDHNRLSGIIDNGEPLPTNDILAYSERILASDLVKRPPGVDQKFFDSAVIFVPYDNFDPPSEHSDYDVKNAHATIYAMLQNLKDAAEFDKNDIHQFKKALQTLEMNPPYTHEQRQTNQGYEALKNFVKYHLNSLDAGEAEKIKQAYKTLQGKLEYPRWPVLKKAYAAIPEIYHDDNEKILAAQEKAKG